MEPKRSESVHQGNLMDSQAAQPQEQLQCSAPPTARAGATPVAQPFAEGAGSRVAVASSAPAGELSFSVLFVLCSHPCP